MVHWKQSREESNPSATRNLSIKISNDMRVKARFAVQAKLCWNCRIYYILCIVSIYNRTTKNPIFRKLKVFYQRLKKYISTGKKSFRDPRPMKTETFLIYHEKKKKKEICKSGRFLFEIKINLFKIKM